MGSLKAAEYETLLRTAEALQSSLDLTSILDRAAPLLRQLVGADHVALAVSVSGNPFEFAWHNDSLPKAWFEGYDAVAERDFIRAGVMAAPNRVILDQQLITRKEYARHVICQHARATGANLEHAMAVLFRHEASMSGGLTLYRDRCTPFSEHEAKLIQMMVPHVSNAIRLCRQHAYLQRELWLEPVANHAGLAVLWLDREGREVARTASATRVLETYFPAHERRGNVLPDTLREYFNASLGASTLGKVPRAWTREDALSSLHVSLIALREHGLWALVFVSRGIDPELSSKLSPRLLTIAGSLLRGMSNEEIARRDGRSLATIKQQSSEVYRRLGVEGRKGLMRLAAGFQTDDG